MIREIVDTTVPIIELLVNKVIVFVSLIVGVLLSAIGYPKEVLMFLLWLIVFDMITKQYAIVKKNFKYFNLHYYFMAWKYKYLTSRELKNGIGVKSFLYFPVLFVAHKSSITPEILYGEAISSVLYTLLMLVEVTSVMENFIMAGHTNLIPILKYIKSKEEQIAEIKEEISK